ncbi:hypothetical protein AVEN_242075-1, partial [Araneus ventricosus]
SGGLVVRAAAFCIYERGFDPRLGGVRSFVTILHRNRPSYENEGSRPISPGSVVYTTTLQYPQEMSHGSAPPPPMWGANTNSGAYLTGLGSPILEANDVGSNGRGSYGAYMANPAYLLTSGNETGGWSTLPPMSSSAYLQEGRRTQYSRCRNLFLQEHRPTWPSGKVSASEPEGSTEDSQCNGLVSR